MFLPYAEAVVVNVLFRFVLVWLVVVGLGSAAAQTIPDNTAAALQAIQDKAQAAAASGFGGAILIEDKGRLLLAKGYGLADREKHIPFTPGTVAQIGSITKSMTAFAVLELAHDGKIDLEKPVKAYLPDAAEPAGSAIIRNLLTHHAGLTDSCSDDFDRVSTEHLLHTCMALPLAFTPGTDHYSNMGYSVLAALVERVSGMSWETFLREHIWQPLGMRHTGFSHFNDVGPDAFAHGYLDDKVQSVISYRIGTLDGNDWNLRGNGGIQSSATDMERYYRGLSGKIAGLPQDVVRMMTMPHAPMGGEAWEGYGLFVRLDARAKPYRIGFSGSDGTFFSYFGWLPQQNVFFYVVGNNGEANVRPVVATVLKAALKIAKITPDMLQPPQK
jgi:CubicO group peptidase (beta-lactamase class C family)